MGWSWPWTARPSREPARLHQDVGLFLLPVLVAVLLVADRLVARRYRGVVGWTAFLGVTLLLVGGGVWVFVNPAPRGPGYVLLSAGMGLVALSIATTVVSGLPGDRKLRFALPRRPHSPVPHG